MTLVPIEMLENMTKNSTLAALQEPDKEYLLKKIDSVNDLNTSTDLPENVKANRLAQNIKEVSVMANKIIPSESINTPTSKFNTNVFENYEKHLENIPKTYQRSAKTLLRHQNRFLVDEKTNEVMLDGVKLANSNFVDLIGDIARSRKRGIPPLHREKFLEFLSSLNVPEELIGNKTHITTLRKYKATNNQNRLLQEEDDEELDGDRESDNIESVKVVSGLQDVVSRRRIFKPKLDKSPIFKLKHRLQKTNSEKKNRKKYQWKKV